MNRLLLHNADLFDPSGRCPNIHALYIEHGTIARLYKRMPRLGNDVQKINLHKTCIMPGFIDSHTHLVSRGLELQYIDLSKCRSLNDCLTVLHEQRKNFDVVFASNWDESAWTSFKPAMLTRHVLDRISIRKPVLMRRVCGHCAVVNTCALKKIPKELTIIDRQRGWLYEDAALYLNSIFKPDAARERKAVELACAEAVRQGITSIHEIGNLNRFSLLQQARKSGALRLRVGFYVLVQEMKNIIDAHIESGFGDGFLRFAGIKIFMDGSIGAQTAAMTRPYQGSRSRGKLLTSIKSLRRIAHLAEQHRLQLMIHTIGDRTAKLVVSALDGIISTKNRLRHRLEHLELVNEPHINAIARLHLIASMQPNFAYRWQQPGGMYEEYLGMRYRKLNRFRTIQRSRIKLVFGSDCMPLDPLYGIQGACEHPISSERISRTQAFTAYTGAGAYATNEEHFKGKIKQGMAADLVVLNNDPRVVDRLDSLRVMRTIIAGKTVYQNKS